MKIRTYIILIVVMSCLITSSSLWKQGMLWETEAQSIIPEAGDSFTDPGQ